MAKSDLEQYLRVLSLNVIPNDEYVDYGTSVVRKIFDVMGGKSRYAIDRMHIAGSTGKHTSVVTSDFDCVLLVNDEEPPYKKVLDDFERILKSTEYPTIKNLRRSERLLQFDAALHGKQIVEIDLVPAANFAKNYKYTDRNEVIAYQAWLAIQKIKQDPGNCDKYTTCLAEVSLEVLRHQSAFVHELVRLAKFWNKTLHLDEFVYARSTFIEVVAIDAGLKEEAEHKASGDRSLLRGFQRFLQNMAAYQDLEIKITNYNPLKGSKIDPNEWSHAFVLAKHKVPYVVNTGNPFINILDKIPRSILAKFQQYALETLRRMNSFNKETGYLLFEPQPKVILPSIIAEEWTKPAGYMAGVTTGRCELQPTTIIRNNDKVKDKSRHLKSIKTCLVTSIHSFVNLSTKANTSSAVQAHLHQTIDVNIAGMSPRTWSGSGVEDSFDVTFVIPFTLACDVGKTKYFATASMKWN